MKNLFENYIQSVASKFSHEETSEMGYRADFENLLKGIFATLNIKRIDHDARSKDGNKPDFAVYNHDLPILYIEAKDIGVSLDKVEKSEQMARYYGYKNLVLTDYVEFRFYRDGIKYGESIKIANYNAKNRTISPISENYEYVAKTLIDFSQSQKEPIKSGQHLAKIMGGKAQRIRDNVRHSFISESYKSNELTRVYETIKKLLVHDLTTESFADMYAQTLVYGLFVARYHDDKEGDFTRQKARELVPASNPLLRHFFDHIVGPDFDKRLEYIVNELCEVFSHANVKDLMSQYFAKDLFGETHEAPDPVIHFYEDFLKEYDPELRKKMGAFYTPLPVVRFIVRAVDFILEKEFDLSQGLANSSKVKDMHKVQILDPAVGTGTFLTEVIKNIYSKFETQKGRWPEYVYRELLPRLYGFELMMAPYTIAHLKMSMVLKQTGFKYFNRSRLGIYLTNSLEGVMSQKELPIGFGFAESIAEESKEASKIKNDRPIMVIVGNPPYSGESNNAFYKEQDVYKIEPGTNKKLNERNSKWINDDYVKFIRFAEIMVEKNGEGIVAMITAHGYLDNPTFRGMRYHLMSTFEKIYIVDLHGNARKKEKNLDGTKDENVFNIMTGVSIFIGVKKREKISDLAKVFRADSYGLRQDKFNYLDSNSLNTIKWKNINPSAPNYEWVLRDNKKFTEYEKGFPVDDIFLISSVGIVTSRDDFVIDFDKNILSERINSFLSSNLSPEMLLSEFGLRETMKWKIKNVIKHNFDDSNITEISYRPFDNRFVYYDDSFIERSRREVMKNMIRGNLGLIAKRGIDEKESAPIFISKYINESRSWSRPGMEGIESLFPFYIFSEDGSKSLNLKKEFLEKVKKNIGEVSPEEILDYIYATLHSLKYRERFEEFLKIDFPRVPYPEDKKEFNRLAKLGAELRELHLMEDSRLTKFITTYPEVGNNEVDKVEYKDGKVYINEGQYFGKVPEISWNFYIGGYQPAQKWLKDRKGRRLTNDEIEHYQKIIISLLETDKIIKSIDKII